MTDNVFTFPGAKRPEKAKQTYHRPTDISFGLGDHYLIELKVSNQLIIKYLDNPVIPEAFRNSVAVNRIVLPWEEAMLVAIRTGLDREDELRGRISQLEEQLELAKRTAADGEQVT